VALCFHIYMAILISRLLCSLNHCRSALTVVIFSRSPRIDRLASRNCGRALRSATIAAALGRSASGQHCKQCINCLGELCGVGLPILGERAEVEDMLQVRERFEEAAREGEAPALAVHPERRLNNSGHIGALARRGPPALHALRREHLAAVLRRD
jgi:hypothetical protein